MKKIFVLLFVIVLSFSLGAKIITTEMNSKVNEEILKPIKSTVLDEYIGQVSSLALNDGKIYFASPLLKTVFILNEDGKFLKILDSSGKGPGEFAMPSSAYFDEKNNRFGIVDQMNRRTSFFDPTGNYIEDVNFTGMNIPMEEKFVKENTFLKYFMKIELNREKGTVLTCPTIEIVNDEKKNKIFESKFNPMKMQISNTNMPFFTVLDEAIAITKMNKNDYKVELYDLSGKNILNIEKEWKKIKYSEEEILAIEKQIDQVKKQLKAAGREIDINFGGYEYRSSIEGIISSDEKIFVKTVDKKGVYLDVYNLKGEFLKKIRKETGDFGVIKIDENKLFEITFDKESEVSTLNIYKLEG